MKGKIRSQMVSAWTNDQETTLRMDYNNRDDFGDDSELDSSSGNGTDTDTSSDSFNSELSDEQEFLDNTMPENRDMIAYLGYRRAKRRWRRRSGKPVRKARRFARRNGRRGGATSRAFLGEQATAKDADSVHQYMVRRKKRNIGKGKGKGTYKKFVKQGFPGQDGKTKFWYTAKGQKMKKRKFGRKKSTGFGYFGKTRSTNPKGGDGKTLACHGCGSETHLWRDCPKNSKKGQQKKPISFDTHFVNLEKYDSSVETFMTYPTPLVHLYHSMPAVPQQPQVQFQQPTQQQQQLQQQTLMTQMMQQPASSPPPVEQPSQSSWLATGSNLVHQESPMAVPFLASLFAETG